MERGNWRNETSTLLLGLASIGTPERMRVALEAVMTNGFLEDLHHESERQFELRQEERRRGSRFPEGTTREELEAEMEHFLGWLRPFETAVRTRLEALEDEDAAAA